MKILFVCMGNICRSPIAEGIMRKLLSDATLSDYHVASAGTKDWNLGYPADQRAVQACSCQGVDITRHRARQASKKDFDDFDLIFVVDDFNERELRRIAPPSQHHKIRRLPDPDDPSTHLELPDPYHGDAKGFTQCFSLLEKSLRIIAAEVKNQV